MIQISEWMPNPIGSDSGEWVEIFNPGPSIDLSGWKLMAGGKKYLLAGRIKEGEYKVLYRSDLGFQLRNVDGELALISPEGKTEISSFAGTAPEGKSLNSWQGGYWFSNPSMGLPNPKPVLELIGKEYETGTPINQLASSWSFWGGLLGTVVTLCLVTLIALKQNHEISEFFFGSN